MSRYEPLTRYLGSRTDQEISLAFREIEVLLGRPLPASARIHQAWWANTPSHVQADAWMRAGRRTGKLDLGGERVAFVRQPGDLGVEEQGSPYIGPARGAVLSLQTAKLTGAGLRLIEDHARATGLSLEDAIAALLNAQGLEHRGRRVAEIAAKAPQAEGLDTVDIIRELRDGR